MGICMAAEVTIATAGGPLARRESRAARCTTRPPAHDYSSSSRAMEESAGALGRLPRHAARLLALPMVASHLLLDPQISEKEEGMGIGSASPTTLLVSVSLQILEEEAPMPLLASPSIHKFWKWKRRRRLGGAVKAGVAPSQAPLHGGTSLRVRQPTTASQRVLAVLQPPGSGTEGGEPAMREQRRVVRVGRGGVWRQNRKRPARRPSACSPARCGGGGEAGSGAGEDAVVVVVRDAMGKGRDAPIYGSVLADPEQQQAPGSLSSPIEADRPLAIRARLRRSLGLLVGPKVPHPLQPGRPP